MSGGEAVKYRTPSETELVAALEAIVAVRLDMRLPVEIALGRARIEMRDIATQALKDAAPASAPSVTRSPATVRSDRDKGAA